MDPKDLFDNAQNLDFAVNDITKAFWKDRFGRSRPTMFGMEQAFSAQLLSQQQRFDNFIQSSGYKVIGDYTAGPLTINEYNQLIRYQGELYKLTAATPLGFTTTGNDATSWANDSAHFVSVGDAALRQELAAPDGADMIGAQLAATGSVYRTQADKNTDTVSVKDFGAKGDGVTDDGPAIRAAIAALKAADGGTLFFPSGEYLVGAGNPLNSFYALSVDFNGLRIQGDGIWKTSIKVANGANVGPLHLAAATGFEIDNITLDGNAAGQSTTGVHGLAALDADFVIGTNLQIKNTVGYGIGFQGTMTTNFQFVKFDGLYLQDIGGDGTDFKNKALTNKGLIFSNVYVNGVGRTEAGKKAGLDIRGPATLTNIHIYANGNKVTGVRFRGDEILGGPGNPGNGNGIGGRDSSLTNFHMNLEGFGDSDGVVVDNENVSVSNGTVLNVPNGGTGVFATASAKKSRLNNVSAAATGNAILFELAADDLQVSNCTALSAAGLLSVGFRYNGDRIHLGNCKSFNGQYGFRRSAGSVPSYLTNCSSYGASSADLVTSVDDFTFNCWFDTSTHKNATVSSGPSKLGEFMYVQDSVNWPRFDPSVSGSPVAIRATGADAAVDLLLAPRGSGNVRFGSFGSSADVPVTGYITIKDAAGTVRKLAVIS